MPDQPEIIGPESPDAVIQTALNLLRRTIEERCGAADRRSPAEIRLQVDDALEKEAFSIASTEERRVTVSGGDASGLLYGVGKLLRDACYTATGFEPGEWRGKARPEKSIRGIYFATHFFNFYHRAPLEEVRRYVAELALWGTNALMVWYDMHHFNGITDPAAQEMIARLHAILEAGKRAGMGVGLGVLANEGYANSPEHLRAQPTGRAHYGVELCPYIPGAMRQLLTWFEEEFEAFSDIGLDYLWIWPYDQGGCGCGNCRPWGANGLIKCGEAVSGLFRRFNPDARVILSTWLLDMKRNEGEWEGLAEVFSTPPEWVDYLLADSHTVFPRFPIEEGVPGGLPLLNFPEISMWGMYPWGGYGANPLPARLQELWDSVGEHLSGGFPYSEGIFEDMNKAAISQFYWNAAKPASETLREYIAYEFAPDVVDEVWEAVQMLEANHQHMLNRAEQREERRFLFEPEADTRRCRTLLEEVDGRLPPYARSSWRWRILLLRGIIDDELARSGGNSTTRCEEAFQELLEMYHAQDARHSVHPPITT